MADPSDLLERFKPRLQYDSQEAFFADDVAMMTDGRGCRLRQDGGRTLFGGRGVPALAVAVLRDIEYGEDNPVTDTDRVCLASKRYRSDYSRLCQERPQLRHKIYGRAERGSDERLWLQYWFFYVYNDYQLAARFGLHEGDWEMISLRIDEEAEQPDLAVYAQHAYAEQRPWDEVLKDGERPLVYVARGSHGSYFEPGMYNTEVFYDIADGQRDTDDHELLPLNGDDPAWPRWPGVWGATRARWKAEADSPPAPVRHDQWTDPAFVMTLAEDRPKGAGPADPPPKPAGKLGAERLGRRLLVTYEGDGGMAAVVATLNSREEKGVPPRTFTFDIDGRARGRQVVAYASLEPAYHYIVGLSLVRPDSMPSESVEVPLEPVKPALRANVIGEIRLVLHWIRDHVRGLFSRRRSRRA
jgi:hypothetical protein